MQPSKSDSESKTEEHTPLVTLSSYGNAADRTANYPLTPRPSDNPVDGPDDVRPLLYPVLGLAGEAGELANKLKKIIRDDRGVITFEKRAQMLSELGDVLWYLHRCAVELESSLDEVAEMNIVKLDDRQRRNRISGDGDAR